MFTLKNTKSISRELCKSNFLRYFLQGWEGVSIVNRKIELKTPIETSYSPIRKRWIFCLFWFTASSWCNAICRWWSHKLGKSCSNCSFSHKLTTVSKNPLKNLKVLTQLHFFVNLHYVLLEHLNYFMVLTVIKEAKEKINRKKNKKS